MGSGFLEHPPRVLDRLGDGNLVGEERQVDEHQRAPGRPPDGGGMVDHLVERGAERSLVAGDHLVQ
jgi:hypothetical protein